VAGDGVLNIKKQAGWTSHDVVARLRKSFGGRRIGHAGTLDPEATGVLPVLIGRGTRIAEYLLDWDKEYRAVLRLGETTDTLDATGVVLERRPVKGLSEEAIRQALAGFKGRIRQVPPMYSAVKIKGVPLYKTAREGRVVDRPMRDVTVHRLEVERINGEDIHLSVVCSKGTYIRTLCADIGEALQVGGHLFSLERTRVGPLTLDQALTVEEVESQVRAGRIPSPCVSLDAALSGMPACKVGPETARVVLHGAPVPYESVMEWDLSPADPKPGRAESVRIKDHEGRLLAIGLLSAGASGIGGGPLPASPSPCITVKKVLVSEVSAACV
jgi:tRNA pseudouridine55 synthase